VRYYVTTDQAGTAPSRRCCRRTAEVARDLAARFNSVLPLTTRSTWCAEPYGCPRRCSAPSRANWRQASPRSIVCAAGEEHHGEVVVTGPREHVEIADHHARAPAGSTVHVGWPCRMGPMPLSPMADRPQHRRIYRSPGLSERRRMASKQHSVALASTAAALRAGRSATPCSKSPSIGQLPYRAKST
jgi:hypothetical protein